MEPSRDAQQMPMPKCLPVPTLHEDEKVWYLVRLVALAFLKVF